MKPDQTMSFQKLFTISCLMLLTLPGVCFSTPLSRHARQTGFNFLPPISDSSNNNGDSNNISDTTTTSGPAGVPNLPPLGQPFGGFPSSDMSQPDGGGGEQENSTQPASGGLPVLPNSAPGGSQTDGGTADSGNAPDSGPPPFHLPPLGCLDLCSSFGSDFCENGGTCITNSSACTSACSCTPGLDPDNFCRTASLVPSPSSGTSDNTTNRPLEERDCYGNGQFVCEHGKCQMINGTDAWLCACDRGWTGDFCHIECTLDCGERGSCRMDVDTNEPYCSCPYPWQGPKCDEQVQDEPVDYGWVYWMGGGLGAGLLLLLCGGAALMVFLWRRRLIVVMKIVHYFQPYEDADGRLFDAFVSYRSSPEDLDFVYNHLRHKLEGEMHFNLCLHERDFPAGEAIANNIIWATENSRRTILVISPRYLDSDWARMEYQRAQYETLKRKQRIIPIMLEDVSEFKDKMDPNLAYILRTVTYLEHPGKDAEQRQMDKFWKRLQLSMPKKKDTTTQTTPESDVTPMSVLTATKGIVHNGRVSVTYPEQDDLDFQSDQGQADLDIEIATEADQMPPAYETVTEMSSRQEPASHEASRPETETTEQANGFVSVRF